MKYTVQAACVSSKGKIRRNNEDNFLFNGYCLPMENSGLTRPISVEKKLRKRFFAAVFDGMGGENFGELASFCAVQQAERRWAEQRLPEEVFLEKLSARLDQAVILAQKEKLTDRMGTTMVSLSFTDGYAYMCNVGDSRAYRLRDGELAQMSVDHVEKRPGRDGKKAPLTQYLGFGSEDIQIEPHIAKCEIKKGDMYLICSDGVTDMLPDSEISYIMLNSRDAESCVQDLLHGAMEHGGRDNITAIVCQII